MRFLRCAVLGAALVFACVTPSAAQDYGLREPMQPETRSYAHWVLLVDGISAGTLGLAAGASVWCLAEGLNDGAVGTELPCGLALIGAVGGGVGFLIAPMFVHGSHGRWGAGARSVALRIGLPITALVTLAPWAPYLAAPAVPLAFLVAVVIDWVFLAEQERPPPERRMSVVATGAGVGLRVLF